MKGKNARAYSLLMNCTAPVLTAVFLGGAVCWAAEIQYDDVSAPVFTEVVEPVGAEKGLKENYVSFGDEFAEPGVPVSDIAIMDNANQGAELIEACGVYIGDEFVGAVADGEYVEQELDRILEDYTSDDSVIEADFAVVPDIKQGIYRTEALVKEEDMTDFLSGEKNVVAEYTADSEETPEKIAEDHGMSLEEVKELNPEMDREGVRDGEQVKVRETVSVLPVKYVCEEQEEEVFEVDSFKYNSDYELVPGGVVGKKLNTYQVTYIDGDEVSRKLKSTETVEMTEEEIKEHMTAEQAVYTESIPENDSLPTGNFIWPVNGGSISDPFGSDRNHKGMDIAAPGGTDIYASDGGTVLEAGWNDGGYGNYVIIDHGNGYVTLYGHASEVFVTAGEKVNQGQLIAAVGTTGDSTGNHCHFEVRYNGEYLNPDDFV